MAAKGEGTPKKTTAAPAPAVKPAPVVGSAKKTKRPAQRAALRSSVEILSSTDLSGLVNALRRLDEGDFTVRLDTNESGQMAEAARRFNVILDRKEEMGAELARVRKVLGREGKTGERIELRGARGAWAEQMAAVNETLDDLVRPTAEVARVIDAVAQGDLGQKMSLIVDGQPIKGEFQNLGKAVNAMVDQLSAFASEVTRVAGEVGTEGILGGQAKVKGVSGTWNDLTENVNFMADNLTKQVRGIAKVVTAVAEGDLEQKFTIEAKGEVAALADTINSMIDQLRGFASEVTRVAREVGTEGILGGQAKVEGVSGTWNDLTKNVNFMADNLTAQVRGIAKVVTAVAEGDLEQKFTIEAKGEVADLADTINSMIDQLRGFASEVTRVAREVGTEGILGGQAKVEGVSGTWNDLTENVNFMADNLTAQVRGFAKVITAVAEGDLEQKFTIEAKGEVAALADTINGVIDQLRAFASEVTRVAREVGTEGILGGQAKVKGVSGTWNDLTENVNFMADNLTKQVRGIAKVVTAVAEGDLEQKFTIEAKGEVAALADTINSMIDQLRGFASEVTRVAREVGTEGILGGQAKVEGVSGTWNDLTENVNFMADNLTAQVRGIAKVVTAVAEGDLEQKFTIEAKGEVAALADAFNSMIDQLRAFASEVTRVAREVGTEGILGGQAKVEGVSGTWNDLTDSVNVMADNLTAQVRGFDKVITAVADGDLDQKFTIEAKGEVAALADTINSVIDQLRAFASEVTRVAREVGTEGILGGQAKVEGVSGTWNDLTENVNFMADNLTAQVRGFDKVITAVAAGDLEQKFTIEAKGEVAALADTINSVIDQLRAFASEVTRVAREVGTEGILGGQAKVEGVSGTWNDLTENVNQMADNLTQQVRGIAKVVTAVAEGDLEQKFTIEAKGEVAALADTFNSMIDQLRGITSEVTRVAREVGTQGILGGQAEVKGVSGTWKDLTENVNFMADNLTKQVRGIAKVVTAVAEGDLDQKFTIEAEGEVSTLADTINLMIDQLRAFASEVTRVAKEVGTEGKLGGQAEVEGVSGVWKNLTDNVNQMAGSLTTQVRAIADVSSAVTEGDLTRSIDVEAAGEVAELKDKINQMIANLKETTERNAEQDWLNTNLARFSSMLTGERDLKTVAQKIMRELTPLVNAQHGAFFISEKSEEKDGVEEMLHMLASYGYEERKGITNQYRYGQSLVGQAALEGKPIMVTEVPPDYIRITSGLGAATPLNLLVLPILFEEKVMAVIEIGSFSLFTAIQRTFLEQLAETFGVVLNTIQANMRTEGLLEQSQSLAEALQSQSEELKTQQEELQQTNEELEGKASALAEQNRNVEVKNREIESSRRALEEKAEQLTLSSKYKSEFLANMSHELRTPLNSLLILSKLLSDNLEQNLSVKQVDYAKTIYNAGNDLLLLINDILDLSKVEAGKMDLLAEQVSIARLVEQVEEAFRPLAEDKQLELSITSTPLAPKEFVTDEQRLRQVLKNLLSNAVKFTDKGRVSLEISKADPEKRFFSETLNKASAVVSFTVADTGIGIPEDKRLVIFEAFQQADGTTSRSYGGTGLGLSISREITRLLGGEIEVESTLGEGSRFTLYLPLEWSPPDIDDDRVAFAPIIAPEEVLELEARIEAAREMIERSVPEPLDLDVSRQSEVEDDEADIAPGDRIVLVVEDDPVFAGLIASIARGRGFKALVALSGEEGLGLARKHAPDAIVLDLQLPKAQGLTILEHLKAGATTRHIPVHIISGSDARLAALEAGALSYLEKPVSSEALTEAFGRFSNFLDRSVKRILVVEDDDRERQAIVELIGQGKDVEVQEVGSAEAALKILQVDQFDCLILDLKLSGRSGFQLLEDLKNDERMQGIPVIVYTGKDLTREEESVLRKYAQTIIVKDARSPERLLDETALFLHHVESELPEEKRRLLEEVRSSDGTLEGKKILIVDDDVRNVFALSGVLSTHGLEVIYAENGLSGLELLKANPDTALVLMDVMMPEMDGYETTAAIRALKAGGTLPIIIVTAKAMKGDREEALAAGASDYITKPVDIDKLLSLMRVWIPSAAEGR